MDYVGGRAGVNPDPDEVWTSSICSLVLWPQVGYLWIYTPLQWALWAKRKKLTKMQPVEGSKVQSVGSSFGRGGRLGDGSWCCIRPGCRGQVLRSIWTGLENLCNAASETACPLNFFCGWWFFHWRLQLQWSCRIGLVNVAGAIPFRQVIGGVAPSPLRRCRDLPIQLQQQKILHSWWFVQCWEQACCIWGWGLPWITLCGRLHDFLPCWHLDRLCRSGLTVPCRWHKRWCHQLDMWRRIQGAGWWRCWWPRWPWLAVGPNHSVKQGLCFKQLWHSKLVIQILIGCAGFLQHPGGGCRLG